MPLEENDHIFDDIENNITHMQVSEEIL